MLSEMTVMNIMLLKQDSLLSKVHYWHSKGPGSTPAFHTDSLCLIATCKMESAAEIPQLAEV